MSPLRLEKRFTLTENLQKRKIVRKKLKKSFLQKLSCSHIVPKNSKGILCARKTIYFCQKLKRASINKNHQKSRITEKKPKDFLVFPLHLQP